MPQLTIKATNSSTFGQTIFEQDVAIYVNPFLISDYKPSSEYLFVIFPLLSIKCQMMKPRKCTPLMAALTPQHQKPLVCKIFASVQVMCISTHNPRFCVVLWSCWYNLVSVQSDKHCGVHCKWKALDYCVSPMSDVWQTELSNILFRKGFPTFF